MKLIKIGEKDDKMILKNEEGFSALFSFVDMILYKGKEYAAIADENDEIYIMEFSERGKSGKETYIEISDDNLFDTVLSLFEEQSGEFD